MSKMFGVTPGIRPMRVKFVSEARDTMNMVETVKFKPRLLALKLGAQDSYLKLANTSPLMFQVLEKFAV